MSCKQYLKNILMILEKCMMIHIHKYTANIVLIELQKL